MIAESLQGQGSYTYVCRKWDCEHCRLMGLKPEPELFKAEEPKEFNFKNSTPIKEAVVIKRTSHQWSGEENRVLREHRNKRAKDIKEFLPGRTIQSINIHLNRMKKLGMIR